jgi:hypothetical protein
MRNAERREHLCLRLVALAVRDGDDLRLGEDHSLLALDAAHDNGLLVDWLFALSLFLQAHDYRVAGRRMAVPLLSADYCVLIFSPNIPLEPTCGERVTGTGDGSDTNIRSGYICQALAFSATGGSERGVETIWIEKLASRSGSSLASGHHDSCEGRARSSVQADEPLLGRGDGGA